VSKTSRSKIVLFELIFVCEFRYIMGDQTMAKSTFSKHCGETPKSLGEYRDVIKHSLEGSRKVFLRGLHVAR